MVIIYYCYGGAHSSPIAAAIHIGVLKPTEMPSAAQILAVCHYDKVESSDRGKVMYVGNDEYGNKVYVCGRGRDKIGIKQAIESGIVLAKGKINDFVFVDTLNAVNLFMRIGGFLSRRIKWIAVGRPLVIWGTQKAFWQLVEIVQETKENVYKYPDQHR